MEKEVAIIDLGTNTAHVLIVSNDRGKLKTLFKKRHYTFLAKNGIELINKPAKERLFAALTDFQKEIKHRRIQDVIVTGTEVFRKAKNGQDILNKIKQEHGWKVKLLTGNQEALMIYKGVRQCVYMADNQYVIMDIGGGSVEYIIVKNGELYWKQSFPIGLAKLHALDINDPMKEHDIAKIKNYIEANVEPLLMEINKIGECTLIGSAGSFDVLIKGMNGKKEKLANTISTDSFQKYMNEIIHMAPEERAKVTWIPKERVAYINLAIILIDTAIEFTKTKNIIISSYALKEGLAANYYDF